MIKGIKFRDTCPISNVRIKSLLLKMKSYIFFALIMNNWATNETIDPITAAINNNDRLSLIALMLVFFNIFKSNLNLIFN